jgi:uroporphyrin-III C-methyltransferase/precorrin-2 dehydrogenase/sirohydrochlorin ferrochelatase
MGLSAAAAVRDGLIAAGRAPATPVAIVARGTRPDAVTVTGTLDGLERLAADVGDGPAVIVVGNVVAYSDAWLAALAAGASQEIAA